MGQVFDLLTAPFLASEDLQQQLAWVFDHWDLTPEVREARLGVLGTGEARRRRIGEREATGDAREGDACVAIERGHGGRVAGRWIDAVERGARANIGLNYLRQDPNGWTLGVTAGRVLRADDLAQVEDFLFDQDEFVQRRGGRLAQHLIIELGDLERIFDPFYTTKPSGKGTGLGLAICKKVALRHGIMLQVRSQPGEGTVFSLDWPRRSD